MRRRNRSRALALSLALAAAIGLAAAAPELIEGGPTRAAAKPRPNIIVLETDDQTVESLRVMPSVRDLLARGGTTFVNSFVSNSLCCPSRSTLLTGQYSHNHGVWTNSPPNGGYGKLDHTNTLAVWLQRAGYHTALLGKYLNGYGTRGTPATEIPPGWSEWHASVDPSSYNYWDYTLNEDGTLVHFGDAPADYQTDVYARKASDIIGRLASSEEPFFLWVAFLAPHSGGPRGADDPPNMATPEPAPRHRDRFAAEPLPMPPSFDEADVSDKPRNVRTRPLLSAERVAAIRESYQQRLESLLAVDEAVATIVNRLKSTGELEDTLIVFTSDNGFLQGEHRIPSGKVVAYEPSIRVPLILRGPGIPRNRTVDDLVANVDLAPTMLAAAGVKPGRVLDGTSLLPLARDPLVELGRDILLETPGYVGLRTPRYKYVEYANGDRELYDLAVDPYELTNRVADKQYAVVRIELARRLVGLRSCAGTSCRAGPRLRLEVTASNGRTRVTCVRSAVRAFVDGRDLPVAGEVRFYLDSTLLVLDEKPPFRLMLPRSAVEGGAKLRARVSLSDGRRVTLGRNLRACA